MKYIKIMIISLIIPFLLAISTMVYGKKNINHITYEEYAKRSTYAVIEKDKYKSYYPELENFYIDSNIKEGKDLIEFSDEVVIATVTQESILYGNSIVSIYEVKQNIKGNSKIGQVIKVYENVMFWNPKETQYLSGLTPVEEGNSYVLFLKQPPKPNITNTYAYSTLTYGHINIFKNQILQNYKNNSSKVKEITKYDYVFTEDTAKEEIENYQKIKDEVLQYIDEYIEK